MSTTSPLAAALDAYEAQLLAAYAAEWDVRVPLVDARAALDAAWSAVLRAEALGASSEQLNARAAIAFDRFLAERRLDRTTYHALMARTGRSRQVRRSS